MAGRGGVKIAVALAAMAACVGGAQPVLGRPGDPANAATWYRKCFERLHDAPISDEEWAALRKFNPQAGDAPTDAVRSVLSRLQPVFSAVQRGSRQDLSDFELDYAQGMFLALPHLGDTRQIATLMSKDAMVKLHDGDAAGAASGVAALYRMSGHLGEDRVLISSLVGKAIFGIADGVAGSGLDRAAFTAAESATMLDAARGLGGADPFNIVGSLVHEQEVTVDWLRTRYAQSDDRGWMLDDFKLNMTAADTVAGLMLLDDAHFEQALQDAGAVMGRAVEILQLDDPVEAQFELERLEAEIAAGEHGPLVVVLPAYSKVFRQMQEAQQQVGRRLGILSAIVDGSLDPEAIANAAVWYLRAVQMIEALPPQSLAQLREVAAGRHWPVDESAAPAFAQAAEVIDTLRIGSMKRRCDFSIAPGGETVVPAHLAGLRDAARLLSADAVRLLQEGKLPEAAERLSISLRLSAHLARAGDPDLFGALVSHAIFNATTDLARWSWEAFDSSQRVVVIEAVGAMPARDPFGYLAALAESRRQIVAGLHMGPEAARRAAETVARLDPQRVLFMVAIVRAPDKAPPPCPELDDVISWTALAAATIEAPSLRGAVIRTGDLDPLAGRAVPDIGGINQRFARARDDLRQALRD